MRRLTNKQRTIIKKTACLIMSLALFAGSMAAVPFLVSVIPELSSAAAQNTLKGNQALGETLPVFALGTGSADKQEDTSQPPTNQDVSQPTQPETQKPTEKPTPDDDSLFVTPDNLCWYEIGEESTLNIIDRTSYNADPSDYLSKPFPIKGCITDEPLVLIIHTHGSESYLAPGYDFYSPDEDFRSEDESQTVVHIGTVLCESLNSLGIPTIQDKTMHDLPDYNQSYNNSLDALEYWMEKYPSVKFVIDVHRDSVFDSQGNNIKPFTTIDNNPCAQLMLVVGTDEMGIPHPHWQDNLAFAAHLQNKLNKTYPTLMRPINLRTAEFNQAVTRGSLILEVGSCGNTIEEAENSVKYFADAYAALLKEHLS